MILSNNDFRLKHINLNINTVLETCNVIEDPSFEQSWLKEQFEKLFFVVLDDIMLVLCDDLNAILESIRLREAN